MASRRTLAGCDSTKPAMTAVLALAPWVLRQKPVRAVQGAKPIKKTGQKTLGTVEVTNSR